MATPGSDAGASGVQPAAPASSSPGRPQPKPLANAGARLNQAQEAQSVDEQIDTSVAKRLQGLDLNAIVTSEMRARETAMEERLMGVMKDMLAASLTSQFASGSRSGSVSGGAYTSQAAPAVLDSQEDGQAGKLSERSLVQDLEDRALVDMQGRVDFGFTDVVIRDVVSAVVKDLVGVLEALVDRLLREKKQDTIRTMVAQLVTEDISKVVSVGREMLLKQEVGHLVKDMERLRAEVRQSDFDWNEKFKVTTELRESQDDLWMTIDERHRALEDRVKMLEQNTVAPSQLQTHREELLNHVNQKHEKVVELSEQRDVVASQLEVIDAKLEEISRFKAELSEAKESLSSQIAAVDDKHSKGLEANQASASADCEKLRSDHEAQLKQLHEGTVATKQEIDKLQVNIKSVEATASDTYAKKAEVLESIDAIEQKIIANHAIHEGSLQKLEAEKETKEVVESVHQASHGKWEIAEEQAKLMVKEMDRLAQSFEEFKEQCEVSYATQDNLQDLVKTASDRLRQEFDAKEELVVLQASIDTEKERISQNARQQHAARDDLNATMEEVQQLRSAQTSLMKQEEELEVLLGELDKREKDHWEKEQATTALQQQSQRDLEVLLQAMKEELTAHVEFQNAEGSKLKEKSTQRYFEQMEKALQLQQTVEKVETGHKDLSDQVKSIRLPPVKTAEADEKPSEA